ncbi:MAG: cytochrome [Herminiimonas sp.]|nr:cytochrome [Herminiimonas sp.]
MRFKHFLVLVFAVAAYAGGMPAYAAEPNLTGQRLSATCAACHGTNGMPAAGGALPGLAGQSKESLASSMKAFKAGTRQATVMQQLAKGYTDEQIESIAAYLAAQKK